MRVVSPGVLTFDPVRGAYMQDWEFENDGETFAEEQGLLKAQLGAALRFIADKTGAHLGALVDPEVVEMATVIIQRVSARDP